MCRTGFAGDDALRAVLDRNGMYKAGLAADDALRAVADGNGISKRPKKPGVMDGGSGDTPIKLLRLSLARRQSTFSFEHETAACSVTCNGQKRV